MKRIQFLFMMVVLFIWDNSCLQADETPEGIRIGADSRSQVHSTNGEERTLIIDYSKLNRTIQQEPEYQAPSPLYALLVFGRDAKFQVWVVKDGDIVYLDLNGDGDLTGQEEKFSGVDDCKEIVIVDPDEVTSYTIKKINFYEEDSLLHFYARVEIGGPVSYGQYCDTTMKESAEQAALAHFHGPLAMGPLTVGWKVSPGLALKIGEQVPGLRGVVGTMNADYGCWVVVSSEKVIINSERNEPVFEPAFPLMYPVIEIEFPPKKSGDPIVKRQYVLNHYCCGCNFLGDIVVPDEVGSGMAKVTFSFEAWIDGLVEPATIELPVIDKVNEPMDPLPVN